MNESNSNNASKIFSIDKKRIDFRINNKNSINRSSSSISQNRITSESILTIKNLTSNYLAMRIRSTKKDFYSVIPTYSIIEPNSSRKINFQLIVKESLISTLNSAEHKFKFEGVELEEYNFEEPKKIFDEISKNNLKYNIYSVKKIAEFIDLNNNINQNNSSSKLSIDKNSTFQSNLNSNIQNNTNIKQSKNIENEDENEELERLKVEYYKLKNELGNLSQNYINLKNSVDMEKYGEIPNIYNKNLKYGLPEIKEIKIPTKFAIIFCFISIIFGYYITK
jgi:hypothetical protein